MTISGWAEILAFCALLIALAPLLGSYMAKVYTGQRVFLTPIFAVPERFLYRCFRVDPTPFCLHRPAGRGLHQSRRVAPDERSAEFLKQRGGVIVSPGIEFHAGPGRQVGRGGLKSLDRRRTKDNYAGQ